MIEESKYLKQINERMNLQKKNRCLEINRITKTIVVTAELKRGSEKGDE